MLTEALAVFSPCTGYRFPLHKAWAARVSILQTMRCTSAPLQVKLETKSHAEKARNAEQGNLSRLIRDRGKRGGTFPNSKTPRDHHVPVLRDICRSRSSVPLSVFGCVCSCYFPTFPFLIMKVLVLRQSWEKNDRN